MASKANPTQSKRQYNGDTQAAADELRRLGDARVGADRRHPGKFAVYFFDEDGDEIRCAGGYASPEDASRGVYFVVAEAMLEAIGEAQANADT